MRRLSPPVAAILIILSIALTVAAQSSGTRPLPADAYVTDSSRASGSSTKSALQLEGDGVWTLTSNVNAPSGTYGASAVWTGDELIVWGGQTNTGATNVGGRYRPSTDTWVATSLFNAPASRFDHVAVWTGKEMLIWGGRGIVDFNDGGRYDPVANQWRPITTTNAPPGSPFGYKAVWTGHEMLVWGVLDQQGGLYDPVLDRWQPITTSGAPPTIPAGFSRPTLALVWTGQRAIVFYSLSETSSVSGGRYDPRTDTWQPMSLTNAPLVEYNAGVAWTGREMIVYGGTDADGAPGPNAGGRYDPQTDKWVAITPNPFLAGTTRAVWTGAEAILMGVSNVNSVVGARAARYDLVSGVWVNLPFRECNGPAVPFGNMIWTGAEILTWGAEGCYTGNSTPALRYSPPYQSTYVATSDSDTYIASGLPTEIFGAEPLLFNGWDPQFGYGIERVLVHFPTSVPSRVNVTQASAFLYMYAYSTGANPMNISTHRATAPWNESSTWQTSAHSFESTPNFVVSVGTAFGWYSWDVTSAARAWVKGSSNYGLMFNGNTSGTRNERAFIAKEVGSSAVPFMTVTYTDPAYASDNQPPSAWINSLPPLQSASTPLLITWQGIDQGRGVFTFDVQMRDSATGTWTDWYSWTPGTSAYFDGTSGHTYCFRVRARDYANNVGNRSPEEHCTTFYAHTLTGQVVDQHHAPIANATLQVTPSPLATTLDVLTGQYTLYFADSQARQMVATRSGYTSPPTATISISSTVQYDVVLQPTDNVITNPNFEPDITGWTISGTLPVALTDANHSGGFAAAFDGGSVLTDSAGTLSQMIQVPVSDNQQILSFLYTLSNTVPSSTSYFAVRLQTSDVITAVSTTNQPCSEWCHQWLNVDAWQGQTITLTYSVHQFTGESVRVNLDEVTLGSWLTPIVEQVTPARVDAHATTVITITGDNFLAIPPNSSYITGPIALLNSIALDTHWVNTATVTATVPATVPFGLYDVWIQNPAGHTGALPGGLRVGRGIYLPLLPMNAP